jgi:hypothetical protein
MLQRRTRGDKFGLSEDRIASSWLLVVGNKVTWSHDYRQLGVQSISIAGYDIKASNECRIMACRTS